MISGSGIGPDPGAVGGIDVGGSWKPDGAENCVDCGNCERCAVVLEGLVVVDAGMVTAVVGESVYWGRYEVEFNVVGGQFDGVEFGIRVDEAEAVGDIVIEAEFVGTVEVDGFATGVGKND